MVEKIIFTVLRSHISDDFDKAANLNSNLKEIIYEMGLQESIDCDIEEINSKSRPSSIVFITDKLVSLSSPYQHKLYQSEFNIFLDTEVFDSYKNSGFIIDYSRDLNLNCYDKEGNFKRECLQKLVSCLVK